MQFVPPNPAELRYKALRTNAKRRLIHDFKELQNDPPQGISGAPAQDNLLKWDAIIFGPEETPWEGGIFHLEIRFEETYPITPPVVRFSTQMFHPNIYFDGRVCLDILQKNWTPCYDTRTVLLSLQSLLSDPNPTSPANARAARLFVEDRHEYNRLVQACVQKSLGDEPEALEGNNEADFQDDVTMNEHSAQNISDNNNEVAVEAPPTATDTSNFVLSDVPTCFTSHEFISNNSRSPPNSSGHFRPDTQENLDKQKSSYLTNFEQLRQDASENIIPPPDDARYSPSDRPPISPADEQYDSATESPAEFHDC